MNALASGSRLQATAFGRIGGRWIADSPGELDPTAPGGTQRPFGLAIASTPCAAYDALPADRRTSPLPRLSCLRGRRWRAVGPPLDPTGGAPVPGVAFGVDGAVGVGGTAYVGVDRFVGRAVDWRVHALIGGRWRATALGGDDPEWNEQGTLFAVRGEPWAIRFDQRTTERSLATRVVVLRLDRRSGRAVQVGSALRDAERFTVPLSYGLATVGRRVYAMATVPNARTGRDEARAFVLR
ncbi:hypothetical protein PAI11_44160 [Patulibacter medicamentivorans]|uniref:Uncharacterized protein n=1 Tax=Patulibacter medicamentivorans TaxID=1097667 RepID=H0EC31_9ACTN|nr:hypothetical protein PAI11_44160 [Patulibacter medicamentivorans]